MRAYRDKGGQETACARRCLCRASRQSRCAVRRAPAPSPCHHPSSPADCPRPGVVCASASLPCWIASLEPPRFPSLTRLFVAGRWWVHDQTVVGICFTLPSSPASQPTLEVHKLRALIMPQRGCHTDAQLMTMGGIVAVSAMGGRGPRLRYHLFCLR